MMVKQNRIQKKKKKRKKKMKKTKNNIRASASFKCILL